MPNDVMRGFLHKISTLYHSKMTALLDIVFAGWGICMVCNWYVTALMKHFEKISSKKITFCALKNQKQQKT